MEINLNSYELQLKGITLELHFIDFKLFFVAKPFTSLLLSLLLGSAVNAQTAPPNYVSQNGLVGWWPFSGNAADHSMHGNNGVANNAVLTTDRGGNAGSAYAFNGSNSSVEVSDNSLLRVRKLTMSVWVFSTNTNPDLYDAVIYKVRRSDAGAEAFSMSMEMSSAVKVGGGCQSGVGWQRGPFNGRRVPLEVWTHLCTTFDGSYLRNYINGQQVEAVYAPGLIDSCTGGNLRFGYAHDLYGTAWNWPFQGKLDDIGIWNRALSAGEIGELYGGAPVAAGGSDAPNSVVGFTTPQVSLSPNPARNAVTLSRSSAGGLLQVRVSDLMGRVVMQESFAGKEKTFSINGILASGLYLVAVTDVQGVLVFRQKLVVE